MNDLDDRIHTMLEPYFDGNHEYCDDWCDYKEKVMNLVEDIKQFLIGELNDSNNS